MGKFLDQDVFNAEMADAMKREKTFQSWPLQKPNGKDMSDAGFFFTGILKPYPDYLSNNILTLSRLNSFQVN